MANEKGKVMTKTPHRVSFDGWRGKHTLRNTTPHVVARRHSRLAIFAALYIAQDLIVGCSLGVWMYVEGIIA